MNPANHVGGEPQRFMAVPFHQPFEAVAEPVDRSNAVVVVEAQDDRAAEQWEPEIPARARRFLCGKDGAAVRVDNVHRHFALEPPQTICGQWREIRLRARRLHRVKNRAFFIGVRMDAVNAGGVRV